MFERICGALTFTLFTSANVCAAELPADTAAYLRQAVDEGRYVGMVVGLVDRDDTTVRGFGVTSKETGRAPDGNTVYEIGSITKTFTATVLAQEVLGGEVKLADPVQRYLPPGVAIAQVGDRPITLEDLATHRSGLPRMPAGFDPADAGDPYADFDVGKLWQAVTDVEPARAPGAAAEYSNFGFAILGQIIARETGTPYGVLLERRIFEPLGMSHSATTLTPALEAHAAQGYGPDGNPTPHWTLTGFAAAGAINSTAHDMLAYVRANMAAARSPGSQGLARAMDLAQQPRADLDQQGIRIGLAWLTTPGGGGHWHNGGTGGFMSFVGFTNDGRRGVVILSNEGMRPVDAIGFHLLDASSPLPATFEEIELAPAQLDEYAGTYALTPEFEFKVTRNVGNLDLQATGQPTIPVFAYDEDQFFAKAVDAQVTFDHDAGGRVVGLTLHQNGQDLHAARLDSDGKPVAGVDQLHLTPGQLDAYVGHYRLDPRLAFTITRDDGQLAAQLTGQPALPIYPEKPDFFVYRVVDAQIGFERNEQGDVVALVLHQNGRNLKFARLD